MDLVEAQFALYVDRSRPNKCHIWRGPQKFPMNGGYHRPRNVAFYVANGRWPNRLAVTQDSCEEGCVNPAHLIEKRSGRVKGDNINSGSSNGRAVLSESDVIWLRKTYATGQYTYQALADACGVARNTVALAIAGKTWSHVK